MRMPAPCANVCDGPYAANKKILAVNCHRAALNYMKPEARTKRKFSKTATTHPRPSPPRPLAFRLWGFIVAPENGSRAPGALRFGEARSDQNYFVEEIGRRWKNSAGLTDFVHTIWEGLSHRVDERGRGAIPVLMFVPRKIDPCAPVGQGTISPPQTRK